MDGIEVIDLCSVSRCRNHKVSEGKESEMQESQDKSKHDKTDKKAAELKTIRDESTIKKDYVESVVENSSSQFYLISCAQGILNSSRLLLLSSPKIACLHVSFTAYENFYKLSKNALSSRLDLPLSDTQNVRMQKSNNQTYIHLYTGFIIHNHICDRYLSGIQST